MSDNPSEQLRARTHASLAAFKDPLEDLGDDLTTVGMAVDYELHQMLSENKEKIRALDDKIAKLRVDIRKNKTSIQVYTFFLGFLTFAECALAIYIFWVFF